MAGITSALENLVSAIFGILNNILNSLLAVLQSIFAVISTVALSVLDLAQNIVGFLVSNIVVIAVVAAAFFGYQLYINRASNGRVSAKKTI